MTSEWAGETARGVRTLFQGVGAGLPDGELLRRFLARDEGSASAFEVLVARHGPAVWGVCRRTLAEPADALDAFQATFLVLVRKAPSVRVGDSLGPWLQGVSTRVARRARADVARRRGRERTNVDSLDRPATEAGAVDDLRAVLDHELARLPARYRSPLILCYLEGLTHEEAAARLACPVGTVRSRLARGRGLLQSRLVRKGFAPSAVASAVAFEARSALAGLPPAVVASTVKLALGHATPSALPIALAARFGRSILLAKLGRGAAVVALLLVTVGVVIAMRNRPTREADGAPLPLLTVAQIADRIEEAADGFSKGLIETEYEEEVVKSRFALWKRPPLPRGPDGVPNPPRNRKAIDLAKPKYDKAPGRSSHASDGLRWKASLDTFILDFLVETDGHGPELQWHAGYDGTIHYRADGRLASIYLGDSQKQAHEYAAPFLFWRREPENSFLKEVLVPEAEITQKTVEGFRCYVVRTPDDGLGGTREVVISARQSYLPIRLTKTDNGEVELSSQLLDLRKLPDGRWYPGRVIVEKRFDTMAHGYILENRRETRITRFEPDHVFKPGDLALTIPWNARVLDYRIGTFYRNDPWWPELRDYLRKEFDWPRADLSPLDHLMSPEPGLEGREAPPLTADRWLRGGPATWESLRGKVVLLVFPQPGDAQFVPALRRLKQAYGEGGFEVVEVLPGGYDPAWADRYFAEWDVNHRVLSDAQLDGELGSTCSAFGVKTVPGVETFTAAYLIDPQGQVHTIAQGGWSNALLTQLHRAGSKTAKPLSAPENLGLRSFRLQTAWQGWVKEAPATARFVGKVVDDQGKPVAGAKVKCQLYAAVQAGWLLQSNLTVPRSLEVTSGPDGSFVLDSLCKGNYSFEVVAPGRATIVRTTTIGPDLGAVDLKLVLAQGDTVSGTILDEAGQPIPGARAGLFGRVVDGDFGTTLQSIELAKETVADINGRFRFQGLWAGRYSLRVFADGRATQTRENVPAGASGLEFRLK